MELGSVCDPLAWHCWVCKPNTAHEEFGTSVALPAPKLVEVSCAVPGRAGSSFLLLSRAFLLSLSYGKRKCGKVHILVLMNNRRPLCLMFVCLLRQSCSGLQVNELMSGGAVQPWKLNLTERQCFSLKIISIPVKL